MSNAIYPSSLRGLGFTVLKTVEDAVIKQRSPSFVETRISQSQNPIYHYSLVYDFLIDNPLKPNASYVYTDLQQLMGFIEARRNSYEDFVFLDPDDNFCGPGMITQGWLPNYPFALGAVIIVGGNAWQVIAAPAGARSNSNGQPSFASSPQADGGLTWSQLGATVGGGWPNPQAQLQLVTDGTNYYSPLQIYRGGQFWEDVTDLASGVTVYANGVASVLGPTGLGFSPPYLNFGGLSLPGFSSSGMYVFWGTTPPSTPITATFSYYHRVRLEDDSQDFEKWANQWWSMGGQVGGSRGKGELKLVTARPTLGIPGGFLTAAPFPAIPMTGGASNRTVLLPTQLSVFQRSDIGYANGSVNGVQLVLTAVGLGSPKPTATFTGYTLPPTVPLGAVKGVYSYAALNGASPTGYDAGVNFTGSDASGAFHSWGRFPPGTAPWANVTFSVNTYRGGTYNFSALQQVATFGASSLNFNIRDVFNIVPQVVVDW